MPSSTSLRAAASGASCPTTFPGGPAEGKDPDRVEETLSWSVELVERPKKPAPEEVPMSWPGEWAKEGVAVDWQKLLTPKGFLVSPRR
jgi:hypothetical protein